MKKIALLTTCFFCFIYFSQGQVAPEDITDKFFALFKEEPLKAMDYAFGTNPFLLENQDGITVLKGRYTEAKQTAGAYQGYERITEKSIGESYKIYSFLVRYERFPLRFIFILYRANDTWCVNNFNYDDELIEELITSAKQDRL